MTKNLVYMTMLMIVVIIAVLLFLLLNEDAANCQAESAVVRDTVVRVVPAKPIVLTKMRTKIVKLSDTVILYHPFRAVIDTVIKHDTIHSYYEFPAGVFSLEYRPKPDTMLMRNTVFYKTKVKKEKWWEKPLMFVGGMVVGYVIGGKK
jgi:hypothetical protein